MTDYCISKADLDRLESLLTVLATDVHALEYRNFANPVIGGLGGGAWGGSGSAGHSPYPTPTFSRDDIQQRHTLIIHHIEQIMSKVRSNKLNLVTHDDYPNLIPAPIPMIDRFADLDLNED